MQLRAGLIGCGEVSEAHAQAFKEVDGVELIAVHDVRLEYAKKLGERYGVPWTTDIDEFYGFDLDVVSIAIPHNLHFAAIEKAARQGVHITVEKPITTILEDADKAIRICKEAGVLLSVRHVARYKAAAMKAAEMVRSGVIGEVVYTVISVLRDKPKFYWERGRTGQAPPSKWRHSKAQSGGGILMMNAIHNVDTMRAVTGLEVERVYSETDTLASCVEVEDFSGVTLRWNNGAIGIIIAGSAALGVEPLPDRIFGTHGQIVMGDTLKVYTIRTDVGLPAKQWTNIELCPVDPQKHYTEAFVRAVRERTTPPIPGEEGKCNLAVILAAYQAAETKAPIKVAELLEKPA